MHMWCVSKISACRRVYNCHDAAKPRSILTFSFIYAIVRTHDPDER
jgi:hypothetical protein